MKDKKYKYLEDLIEDYLALKSEREDAAAYESKMIDKYNSFLKDQESQLKDDDAQHAFKTYHQLKKAEENKKELEDELMEVEGIFIDFLKSLHSKRISYESKDDNKNKTTYLFWLEGDLLKSSE